jgi:methyltransferase (TIGR00027 family)
MYRLGFALSGIPTLHSLAKRLADLISPGGYWAETARVKYCDEILIEGVSEQVPQVIVLGAGLDSRAYRFASDLRNAAVFEVDHPATAAYKRERVEAACGGLPPHVNYVSVDLTKDSLKTALPGAGFDPDSRVLVLWMGVSMYLPADAVADVLSWAGGLADGSSFVFDYVDQCFFEDNRLLGLPRRTRAFLGLSGERLITGFDRGTLTDRLAEHGLAVKRHLTPKDAEARYLRRSDGRSAGTPFAYWGYVHAKVVSEPHYPWAL